MEQRCLVPEYELCGARLCVFFEEASGPVATILGPVILNGVNQQLRRFVDAAEVREGPNVSAVTRSIVRDRVEGARYVLEYFDGLPPLIEIRIRNILAVNFSK